MDVLVKAAALTPLRDNGKRRFTHPTHKQKHVQVTSLLQYGHLILERLKLLQCRLTNVELLHGDETEILATIHCAKRTRADFTLKCDLLLVDLPVFMCELVGECSGALRLQPLTRRTTSTAEKARENFCGGALCGGVSGSVGGRSCPACSWLAGGDEQVLDGEFEPNGEVSARGCSRLGGGLLTARPPPANVVLTATN